MIRYAYLWDREAQAGLEEGLKDRPCAVVLALRTGDDRRTFVYVLPVTHAGPENSRDAIEIPASVKQRLGLDSEQSWICLTEANVFAWPGPDLRVLPNRGSDSTAYGYLPPRFFRAVRDQFLATHAAQKATLVRRTE